MRTVIDDLSDEKIYTVIQLARLSKVPSDHVRAWLKEMEIKPVPALSLGNWYSGKQIRDALRVGACVPVPSRASAAAQTQALMNAR